MIDTSTDFGARVARRLTEERIIWLTTVRADGRPEPSPVWFLWDGASVLIYSQPNTVKLRNIATRPRVALSFNTTEGGDDVIVFAGDAWIANDAPPSNEVPAMLAKYHADLTRPGGFTAEDFARDYPVAIRVTPTKLRGF